MILEESEFRQRVAGCPVCGAGSAARVKLNDVRTHPRFPAALPSILSWLSCQGCGHVFTEFQWTAAGLAHVFSATREEQDPNFNPEAERATWAPVIEQCQGLLAIPDQFFLGDQAPTWVDVGCGSGGLISTAAEFGFRAVGLDLRAHIVQSLTAQGYQVLHQDLLALPEDFRAHVLSFFDVLEHLPAPIAALNKAAQILHPGGVLALSCPNRETSTWAQLERLNRNVYWGEFEHYHNFAGSQMVRLMRERGFAFRRYRVSSRYKACMEIYFVKTA